MRTKTATLIIIGLLSSAAFGQSNRNLASDLPSCKERGANVYPTESTDQLLVQLEFEPASEITTLLMSYGGVKSVKGENGQIIIMGKNISCYREKCMQEGVSVQGTTCRFTVDKDGKITAPATHYAPDDALIHQSGSVENQLVAALPGFGRFKTSLQVNLGGDAAKTIASFLSLHGGNGTQPMFCTDGKAESASCDFVVSADGSASK